MLNCDSGKIMKQRCSWCTSAVLN